MAARVGHDPSVLVDHPLKTQLLALGLGGAGAALTEGMGGGIRAASAVGPIALVQILRRLELKKIQRKYDKGKRRRLSELDQEELFDNGALGLGGSSRLGAVNAYETMRARKYKGYGSLAEAGDAIQMALGAVNPALYSGSIPLISAIDNHAANQMLKRAEFTDQRNNPALPLYLAAAALSSAGLAGAGRWAHGEITDTPPLGVGNWADTVGQISGTAPLMLGTEGRGNAFFYKPRSRQEAEQFLRMTGGLRNHTPMSPRDLLSITGLHDAKLKRLERFGAMVADSDAGAPTIAHEAGHAKIEETPGILRALQRHVYPHSEWLAPLAGAGSMAAGLASGGALKGALLGTGIGALAGIGTVAPEMGASYHAMKHLRGGKLGAEGAKDLLSALSTYLAAAVLPSTLSGAAGGWISGRRRREEEEQEKAANARLRAMLKLRRATQVINPDDVITDAGEAIQTSGTFLPSAASPTGKPLLLFAPGVRRSTKNHELTHLYQSELPSLQQTPGEFFAKIMHRGPDMRSPMELGALLRERKGMPLIDNLKQFNYTAGNWQRRYGGDKSFSPFVFAGRKLGWIPDRYKSAAAQNLQLLSYVPDDALESVRQHGLLSGDALAKPENRKLLELARGSEADAWLAEREKVLKEQPWKDSYAGPSLFFGEPDTSRFGEDHPMKRRKSSPVRINLSKLLADLPETRLHGVELSPYAETAGKYSDEEWEKLSEAERDAVINQRHRDVSLEDVAALVAQAENPSEFWKHFEAGSGQYAGDVPHVQIITPGSKGIPPEYLKMEKAANRLTELLRAGKLSDATKARLPLLGSVTPHAQSRELVLNAARGEAQRSFNDKFSSMGFLRRAIQGNKPKSADKFSDSELFSMFRKWRAGDPPGPSVATPNRDAWKRVTAQRDRKDWTRALRDEFNHTAATGNSAERMMAEAASHGGTFTSAAWPERTLKLRRIRNDYGAGGNFDPETGRIELSQDLLKSGPRHYVEGILGHEVGHALQYYNPQIARLAGRQVGRVLGPTVEGFDSNHGALEGAGEMVGHFLGTSKRLKHGPAAKRLGVEMWDKSRPQEVEKFLSYLKSRYPKMTPELQERLVSTRGALQAHSGVRASGIPREIAKNARHHPALPALIEAKGHSDAKRYGRKGLLLRKLMGESPGDWVVDSDDGSGIVGVTHRPTGFKLHTRRALLPAGLATAAIVPAAVS
jgi:hypothetical protein